MILTKEFYTQKGMDLIIDGTQASLYTKPTIDLTDDVLTELKKTTK